MIGRSIVLTAPETVEHRDITISSPGPDELVVETLCSGISPGTELLGWRGELPNSADDAGVDPHAATSYPFAPGYATVGRVIEAGSAVDIPSPGSHVFAFHPHASHFVARAADVLTLPGDIDPELATLIPNLETAVNLVMDGRPLIGERVIVFGQGVVGLLVTMLLDRFPLGSLLTLDRYPARRARSLEFGADFSLDPLDDEAHGLMYQQLEMDAANGGADLVFELSGNPAALDQAIAHTGFGGRIVVGSWYGSKTATLDLGGRFHRNRIELVSSQVSTIAPGLSGRWDKARRFDLVLKMLRELDSESLVSHRFPLTDIAEAYRLLDQNPDEAMQVVLTNKHAH